MDGSVEWTEMGVASGLDHLAMISPIENFYQALVPGFSSITTRLRHYSFHAWWITHNLKHTRITATDEFDAHVRRIEALYALACAQHPFESGIAGSRFANRMLKYGGGDKIDFRAATDLCTPRENRYIGPKRGDYFEDRTASLRARAPGVSGFHIFAFLRGGMTAWALRAAIASWHLRVS